MRRKRSGTAIQFDLFKSLQPQTDSTRESPHPANLNSVTQGESAAKGQSEIPSFSSFWVSTAGDHADDLAPTKVEIDSKIGAAIAAVARLIDCYGDDYWPILERLENELKMRQSRSSRLSRYLERH